MINNEVELKILKDAVIESRNECIRQGINEKVLSNLSSSFFIGELFSTKKSKAFNHYRELSLKYNKISDNQLGFDKEDNALYIPKESSLTQDVKSKHPDTYYSSETVLDFKEKSYKKSVSESYYKDRKHYESESYMELSGKQLFISKTKLIKHYDEISVTIEYEKPQKITEAEMGIIIFLCFFIFATFLYIFV